MLPIEEIDESVKRPIVTSICQELMGLFGLSENIPMIFKGQSPQVDYLNSEVNSNYLDGNNRWNGESYLTIEDYDEVYNEATLLSTPTTYIDNRGVFLDHDQRIFLVPSYVNKRFTVTMSLTGTEKQIERWAAAIKIRTSKGMLNKIHSVKYHYPIPLKFMQFLVDAHDRTQNVASTNEDLGTYLRRCFLPTMDVIYTAAGTSPLFVIRETQQPIQGWFDFGSGAPIKEKDNELSRYVLKFTYTFYFDVPESIQLITPLVIHNQLIPTPWLPVTPDVPEIDFIKQTGSYSQEAFNYFRYSNSANEYTYNIKPGLSIPVFDDWVGDSPLPGYVTVLRLLIRLDESNLKNVMNLSNLGEWKLNELCRRYMVDTRSRLTVPYQNVMNIMLHTGDDLLAMDGLSVDENLFVHNARDLNLRNMYHLVVTMCCNPSSLTQSARNDFKRHGCFFKYWITTLFPDAPKRYGWDLNNCSIGSDGDTMTDEEIGKVIEDLTGDNDPRKVIWPLVGFFTITSRNEKDS